jgi:hypothetical protein
MPLDHLPLIVIIVPVCVERSEGVFLATDEIKEHKLVFVARTKPTERDDK